MQKAIFLDRDGIINRELGHYVAREEDFILNPGLIPFLRLMQSHGFLFIVISNQGGVAKGLYDHSFLEHIHEGLHTQLREAGLVLAEND